MYRFSNELDYNKDKIIKALKSQEYETASTEIKSMYPSVVSIKKDDTGLNIPGISPRMNINFVENNTN